MTFFGVLVSILITAFFFIVGYFFGKAERKSDRKVVGDIVVQPLEDGTNDLYLIVDDYEAIEHDLFVTLRVLNKASQERQAV